MLIIHGCGGHARSVADVVLTNIKAVKLLFVDSNAKPGEKIYGHDVVKEISSGEDECKRFIAIGNNLCRKKMFDNLYLQRELYETVCSLSAYIGRESKVANGVFVGNFAYIGPNVIIGKQSIVNTRAILEHEVIVGDFSHIATNATVLGRCVIGDNVFIGGGAVVRDKIKITSNVIVGANSTVLSDIEKSGAYVGSPAIKIREIEVQ